MRRTFIALLATTSLAGFAQTASAADMAVKAPRAVVSYAWYATVFGGWSQANDHRFDLISIGTGARFPYAVSLDDGWLIGGAVGRELSPNLRAEIELAHSRFNFGNDYRALPPGTFVGLGESGSMRVTTVTGNVWLGHNFGWLNPYVGGGVGFGRVNGALTLTNGSLRQFDGSDSGLALQGGAGLRFALAPNWEADVSYRWRQVRDVNLASAIAGFRTSNTNVETQSLQVGLTMKLN